MDMPISPEAEFLPDYALGQEMSNVLESGDEAAAPLSREGLQARLTELDQLLPESHQELQGLLDVQAQYSADRDRIVADMQAAARPRPKKRIRSWPNCRATR